MCEQTEINYLDGDVVWVKLGSCWWPGEVVGSEKLPPDLLPSFRKPPIAVVKFFQENSYEYVKNINSIYKYNCSRKHEFINKGLYMYRTKHGHMEKFPEDVIRAETAVGGDIEILTRDEFQEQKKPSYAGLFGDTPKKTPGLSKRGKLRGGRAYSESPRISTPRKFAREKTDYKVHILVQGSKETTSTRQSTETAPSPSTSRAGSEPAEDNSKSQAKPQNIEVEKPAISSAPSTPVVSNSGIYACHSCPFSTSRLNVLILHNRTHSSTFVPYTPSPVRKKPVPKPSTKTSPKSPKVAKISKPKKEKVEKVKKTPKKRQAEETQVESETKKLKTDQEIKSSLLADWDDDVDDESNDESSAPITGSPEVSAGTASPPVPTQAELPNAHVPLESSSPKKKIDDATEKPELSSDSKYEFCEDEDWHVEADAGRKIPRVKNPSKRKEETKSLSIDDEDMAKEVAELLNKTVVPELPSVPEPLKAEENFPEPPVVKSPDKSPEQMGIDSSSKTETKTNKPIFKTKTFFRSRHSRSQDAIGKYVAEQLNAAERMDISESDLNGSESTSSPEARASPVEQVKVARLAPKIQLKKLKAEAAHLRDKEKGDYSGQAELSMTSTLDEHSLNVMLNQVSAVLEPSTAKPPHDVLYPTQEIKPINKNWDEKMPRKEEKAGNDINKEPVEVQLFSISETNKENSHNDHLNASEVQVKISQTPKLSDINEITEHTYSRDNGDGLSETEHLQIEIPQSNTENTEDNNSQDAYSHLPEIIKHEDKVITEISPQKPRILNKELSSPINDSLQFSPKRAIRSPHFSSPQKPYGPSPKKVKEAVFSPDNLSGPKQYNQYMSESTASAVDALLSVSREADRVPKIISNDPPEDLFEDDIRDNTTVNETIEISTDLPSDNGLTEVHEEIQLDLHPERVEESNVVTCQEAPFVESSNLPSENSLIEEKKDIDVSVEITQDNMPSESDLQIAETLLNLPSTAIQNNVNEISENVEISTSNEAIQEKDFDTPINNNDIANQVELVSETVSLSNPDSNLNIRYETELEKNENLNAAQSLVQMSESIDHTVNIVEQHDATQNALLEIETDLLKTNNGVENTVEQNVALLSSENNRDGVGNNSPKFETTTSSKLLKILEEPSPIKTLSPKTMPMKQLIVQPKEKILNFDVAKSQISSKTPTKQKIIIRRAPTSKPTINNMSEIISPDKIILSRNNSAQDGSVQTFTIQTSPDIQTSNDPKQIIIQPKFRKVAKPKLQKLKPQTSLIQTPVTEQKTLNQTTISEEPMFDINSMPVVLSDDILTPENIEKMPIVMSDGHFLTNTTHNVPNPPKLLKTKPTIVENEKIAISAVPEKIAISALPSKTEVKTLLMTTTKSPQGELQKVTTPNILSKSSKLRGAKPMLVIDKATGKQKIIMTKTEPAVKEVKPPHQTIIQSLPQTAAKTEKFIILPTPSSPRPGRQKIVIDPQTGKAHVLVAKGQEVPLPLPENKPVSAKIIPSTSDANASGNTVMIITNAQGTQSRIVLTPEHEKILFPNKQTSVSQLKTITHRISTNTGVVQKTIVSGANSVPPKTQAKIVPKQQKSAIITSKGQLIVGGRIATTAQNIAPMPEIRPAPKRIMASEPKKLVQAIQKNSSEPLIFLQQKSGAVMQLTAAQFEHLQRTGQIIQKTSAPIPHQENKVMVQKSITLPKEPVQKQRVRKIVSETMTPAKKLKQEAPVTHSPLPAPAMAPVPPLTSLTSTISTPIVTISSIIPTISNTVSVSTTPKYSELENFEELLPSTAIARPTSPPAPAPPAPEPAALADGQLLAVPGENFGGPPGSFYLCVEDNGTLTPIDNRPLVLENNQLVPMAVEPAPYCAPPERRDILEAALANSDVFHEPPRDDAPDFRDLNANVSVHCRVSETSTTLNQPIMTPVEVPTKGESEPAVPPGLDAGLAVIGVTPHTVPTSLELPITVTDPRIAPRTTAPLSGPGFGALLPAAGAGPDMTFVVSEELAPPAGAGKSMPLLEEAPDRRLLTPGSDSDNSAEIPLQPNIQISADDIDRHA